MASSTLEHYELNCAFLQFVNDSSLLSEINFTIQISLNISIYVSYLLLLTNDKYLSCMHLFKLLQLVSKHLFQFILCFIMYNKLHKLNLINIIYKKNCIVVLFYFFLTFKVILSKNEQIYFFILVLKHLSLIYIYINTLYCYYII